MDDAAEMMEAVSEVARLAGGIALGHFKTSLRVETKGDGSPVTIADRSAEQAARSWITEHFPHDGIMGEELGTANADAARRWIIDPIDGTRSFIHGVPLWGTLVAVADGENVIAGAAAFPAIDELVCAAPGLGCWWNGVQSHVSTVSALSEATVLTTSERFTGSRERAPSRSSAWRRLAERAGTSRSWGDCYGYLLVATGRAEVMVDGSVAPWDAAAILPIITEAGGVFTDWNGRPTAFGGSMIATNAALAMEVRLALRDDAG